MENQNALDDAHERDIKIGKAWQEAELCCPKCGSEIVSGICLSLDCLYDKEAKR